MPVESEDELQKILELETIAVVGCSGTPGKDAHEIPKFLHEHEYDIVPVNPYADNIFGIDPYDSLSDVEREIDIVDVFRPSEEVSEIADEAIERDDIEVVWTQLGISDPEAGDRIEAAGKRYVEDRCLKVDYRRLM